MDLTAYSIRCRRYYLITTNVQCFHDSTIIRWAEQNCVFFLHRKIIPEVNFICLSHSCISGIISALKRIKREPTKLRCPRSLLLNFMLHSLSRHLSPFHMYHLFLYGIWLLIFYCRMQSVPAAGGAKPGVVNGISEWASNLAHPRFGCNTLSWIFHSAKCTFGTTAAR